MLDIIARNALSRVKQASAEEAVPTAFGNHGIGIASVEQDRVASAMIGEQRAQANRMNFLDGQPVGTNTYGLPLPTSFPVVAQSQDPALMGAQAGVSPKMASMDANQWHTKMANTGYFSQVTPGPEDWAEMNRRALEKTASELGPTLVTLYQNNCVPEEIAENIEWQ